MQTDQWIRVERQDIDIDICGNLVVIKMIFNINREKKKYLINCVGAVIWEKIESLLYGKIIPDRLNI